MPGNWCPYQDDLTQGDSIWQPGEREARLRLDLVPRLSGSWGVGDWLRIRPSVWIRQDLYFGEVTHTTDQRGYAVGDILVSSEISRTFANGLRHAIQPSLQYREIPGQWGSVPGNHPPVPTSRWRTASTTRSTGRCSRRRSARAWHDQPDAEPPCRAR